MRQLGNVLLPARCCQRCVLVQCLPTDDARHRALRGDLHRGRAEFRRRDLEIETHTEIVVSPEDDIELRRVRITNRSRTRRTIEVTSYAEVVLAPPSPRRAASGFSNLFVQTEIIAAARRFCARDGRARARSAADIVHMMTVHGNAGAPSYETDRVRFIGRSGRSHAARTRGAGALSDSAGSVLDPIAASDSITIDSGDSATVDIVSRVTETRDAVMGLIEKYQDRRLADRVFDLAWTHSQVVLRQLGSDRSRRAGLRPASQVRCCTRTHRCAARRAICCAIGADNRLVGIRDLGRPADRAAADFETTSIDLVRQLVQAHAYWRLKGLAVDLVIWNEDHDVYRQQLQEQILGWSPPVSKPHFIDRPGGIFVRHAEQISNEDRLLFESVARVVISDARGTLAEQGEPSRSNRSSHAAPGADSPLRPEPPLQPIIDDLILFNGLGGFTPDGREYVIAPPEGEATPAPWVNVLANQISAPSCPKRAATRGHENAHLYR